MSKELPYFKFFSSEWVQGKITLEDMTTQGLFVNICAWYWSKNCELTLEMINQRLTNGQPMLKQCLNKLIKAKIIKIDEEKYIIIDFLDNQMVELNATHIKRVEAGKKGGKASVEARLKQCSSEAQALRKEEDKIREEKKRVFENFWNLYDKKVGEKEKVFKKWCKLKTEDIKLIFEFIPKYKQSQPDKQYRKNPETFLNNKSWNDEIISKVEIDSDDHLQPHEKAQRR